MKTAFSEKIFEHFFEKCIDRLMKLVFNVFTELGNTENMMQKNDALVMADEVIYYMTRAYRISYKNQREQIADAIMAEQDVIVAVEGNKSLRISNNDIESSSGWEDVNERCTKSTYLDIPPFVMIEV